MTRCRCAMLAALLWGCTAPVSPCGTGPVPVDLRGSWHYEGTQSSPSTATLSGTLRITSQPGQDFYGDLSVTETDVGSGSVRDLSGAVTGCALDATSVDFGALFTVEAAARRHLGTVKMDVTMDSITNGTWVESGPSGPIASGTFKSARQSGP